MGKTYSKDEKMAAVKLAQEIGAVATAERLNINVNRLYTWIAMEQDKLSKANKKMNTAGGVVELVDEIDKLKAELAEKDQELEILQAAITFFTKRRKKMK